jgi:hypothetical protein
MPPTAPPVTGRSKLAHLGVNALAVRRGAGIEVNRDIGFGDGAELARRAPASTEALRATASRIGQKAPR